jgi:glycine reductase
MELEFANHHVTRVQPSESTQLRDGTLHVNRRELAEIVLLDERLVEAVVDVTSPGEPCRIIHVLDVFEPRTKAAPVERASPGIIRPTTMVGVGRTQRLLGAAVVLTGLPPGADDPSTFQEAVIEMAGPGGEVCPFSQTVNVVVSVTPDPALSFDESTLAMRQAAGRAAEHLAGATGGMGPDSVERFTWLATPGSLPRVALVLQLEEWGRQHSFVYGMNVEGILPTLLHPNEVLDGAVTCGTYHQASMRHFTYLLQNHAIIRELHRRHGKELEFVGVLVQRALWASYDDKKRSAEFAAKLLRQIGVTGAVVTAAHGGHAITDLVLTCDACERLGVRVSSLMFEMAGEDGYDLAVVQGVKEAEPVVSTGNAYARMSLPAVDRVLGGEELHGLGGHPSTRRSARDPIDLPLGHIAGANGPTGWGRLTARPG